MHICFYRPNLRTLFSLKRKKERKQPDDGQTSKVILLSGLTNFQDSKTQRTRSQLSTL